MDQPSQTVIPYLIVDDADQAIAFYRTYFAAEEVFRLNAPDGKVGHAELHLGQTTLMLAEEYDGGGAKCPKSIGGTPVLLHLFVDDPDAVADRAKEAGAEIVRAVTDQFYGERSGVIADPFGHLWVVAKKIEDVSPEEMQNRFTGGKSDDVAEA